MASSCSQETEDNGSATGRSYMATVENPEATTRSYNGGNGTFLWTNGDDISVYTSSGFQTMKFKSGAGTGTASYESVTYMPKEVAVFPTTAAKSYADGSLTVSYPSTVAWSSNVNDPLVAQFGDNETTLNFKHVGGVIAFSIKMPAGVDGLTVTADKRICGDFKVDTTGDNPVVATEDNATEGTSVKFTFTKTTSAGTMNFYLPVPTGTYNSLTLTAMNGTTVVKTLKNPETNTIDRCTWTNFELNMCDYKATIEQSVKGVSAFNELLSSKTSAELAESNINLDLDGGSFSTTENKSIQTIAVSSLTIQNGTVEATGLNIKASGAVTIKDVKMTGSFPKANSNARISLNTSSTVTIDGVDFTETTEGYNGIEINLSGNPLANKVVIKNCKFGSKLTNNSILIFGMPEGGVVDIEGCEFELGNDCNPLRISNKQNSNSFTVNIKDCNYKYADTSYEGGTYAGFILFQDYTSTSADQANANKQFSGIKVNCNNVTYGGTKITSIGIGTKKPNTQFAYVYYNKGGCIYDETHYPTFTFE